MERAPYVTMSAGNTVRCCFFQFLIVIRRKRISDHRQVIVFVDQPYIQTCRAGLAMVAVHAHAAGLRGRKASQNGIIPLRFRGF